MEYSYGIYSDLPDEVCEIPGADEAMTAAEKVLEEEFTSMTFGRHLEEAKRALADGFKPDKKHPQRTVWGRVGDARRHLTAVDPASQEYDEARLLMKEVQRRAEGMEAVSASLVERLMVRQREMLADEIEFLYLARGLDIRIALTGPDKSHLTIESAPLCEVFIARMVRDTEFIMLLERADFKKVTLGDGEGFVWNHSFEN